MQPDRLGTLQSFVPGPIQRRLLRVPHAPREPVSEVLSAALIFTDISGFSALTERLAARGERGAEEIQRMLNLVFGQQVGLISEHGGEVWGFAGDATLGLWPVDEGGLAEAVLRASQCGLAIQEAIGGLEVGDDTELQLRTVVAAGEMQMPIVGGCDGRWEALLAGPPLDGVDAALRRAAPGEIVLSPRAWNLVSPDCEGETSPDGSCSLIRVSRPVAPKSSAFVPLPQESEAALRAYAPRSVQSRLEAGQLEWLAEFRRLTTMFVNVKGLDSVRPDFLGTLQSAIRCVQDAVYRYDGSINQVMIDDKGTVVVAGWGVAHHTHEDDAVRGTLAAMAIEAELRRLELTSSIGLTTGRAFMGTRGNPRRREYAMIGDVVNLSARLMQAADPVLCDAPTRADARHRLLFDALPSLPIKGKRSPVSVYRPVSERRRPASDDGELVGRESESGVLFRELKALEAGRGERVVLVEGEPGIGKTRLVAELLQRAQTSTVRSLVGAADAIERSSPYYAWRQIFNQLLGLDSTWDPKAQEQTVTSLIETKPEFEGRASLLNPVLPFEFPESEIVVEMSPKARAETARHLLVRLFRSVVDSRPTMIVFEDAQWLDSASWALAEAVQRQIQPLLLVLVARISEQERTDDLRRFLDRDGVLRITLERLTQNEVMTMVCHKIGVRSLPQPVVKLIWDKAEGHPLFSEELAYALRDRELIRIQAGECEVSSELDSPDAVRFPDTVQGVVTYRIDNLTLPQQLTLKIASVLGRTFQLSVLREVHPIPEDRAGLDEQLQEITRLGLVRFTTRDPHPTFTFKHAITQEVAYGLLSYAQRRRLHRAVAESFERKREFASAYALLAHHWKSAEVPEKALEYLDKAGEQALLRDYANERAVRFFTEAVELEAEQGVSEKQTTLHRARRYRQLGEAYFNLGRFPEGHSELERTLSVLGRPRPGSRRGLVRRLVGELLRQASHRLLPSMIRRREVGQSPLLLEAVRAYSRLGSIYYVTEQKAPFVLSLLSGLNLAERAGLTPELALAYANMGNVAGHIPLHALARAYVQLALQAAHRLDQPSTTALVLARTSIYRTAMGDWQVRELLERSMDIADRLNNHYQWEESTMILSVLSHHRGQFDLGAELGARLYERACQSRTPIHQVWGVAARAQSVLRQGDADHAARLAETTLELLEQSVTSIPDVAIMAYGVLATARIRQGELDLAVEAARATAAQIARSSGVGYLTAPGFSGMAEVYLTLWERGDRAVDGTSVPQRASRACQAFVRYARRYRSAQPEALLFQGRSYWLGAEPRRAQRTWRRSLTAAERLSMPYDEGLAHYEIARHLNPGNPSRTEHLGRAAEIFSRLGAAYDLARTQEEMTSAVPSGGTIRNPSVRGAS